MSEQPRMLVVYDGRECRGFLLNCGLKRWEAFDGNDASLGIFESQKAAADALMVLP
jgi:hypothetical protein